MKNSNKSYGVALAGISASLALVAIVFARFVEPMTIAFNVLAGIFILLPFTKGYIVYGLLCYGVVATLSFFILQLNAFPFIFFFGSYSVVMYLLDFKLAPLVKNKYLRLSMLVVLKFAFFNLAFFVIYKMMKLVLADINFFGLELKYWMLLLIGNVLFVAYDFLIRFVFKNMQYLIDKHMPNDRQNS
ncbi:MAG: hypothetical protein RR454_02355 [Clostridia bacterium]